MTSTRTFISPTDSKFTRLYHEEVDMVFSAIDCVLNGEPAIYCSSELTSGRRVYKALSECGVKTKDELKAKMGELWFDTNVFGPNIASANKFARSVRERLRDKTMVITPAPFKVPNPEWDQPQYLSAWEKLIRTRIKEAWFNRDWEFSNGCAFEFAVAVDAGIPTLDCFGNRLGLGEAIQLLEKAVHRLSAEEFDTSKLQETLSLLNAAVV